MGKTSWTVKERYNKKAYDELKSRLPKGMKEQFKAACEENKDTMNSVIVAAVKDYLSSH